MYNFGTKLLVAWLIVFVAGPYVMKALQILEWLDVFYFIWLLGLLFGAMAWALFGPQNGGMKVEIVSTFVLFALGGGIDQGGLMIGIGVVLIALILFVLITIFGKGWGNPGPPSS